MSQLRIGERGIVGELGDRLDPAVLGEIADPDEIDQRDVDVAAGGEIADLLAQCVLVGNRRDVDLDAGLLLELGQHLDRRLVARTVEEEHLQLGPGIGLGRLFQRPGPSRVARSQNGSGSQRECADAGLAFHSDLPRFQRFKVDMHL